MKYFIALISIVLFSACVMHPYPVAHAAGSDDGSSFFYNLASGLAAAGAAGQAYGPNAFGPQGYRGPTWEQYNQAFSPPPPPMGFQPTLPRQPTMIFTPNQAPTMIMPVGPNNLMVIPGQ